MIQYLNLYYAITILYSKVNKGLHIDKTFEFEFLFLYEVNFGWLRSAAFGPVRRRLAKFGCVQPRLLPWPCSLPSALFTHLSPSASFISVGLVHSRRPRSLTSALFNLIRHVYSNRWPRLASFGPISQ